MTSWQYTVINLPSPARGNQRVEDFLNKYGADGWELVQMSLGGLLGVGLFLRDLRRR